jgi:hypothetical protein
MAANRSAGAQFADAAMAAVLDKAFRPAVPRLFHYTTLDTMWKILEGQELWATHARFSNDAQEVELGKKLLLGGTKTDSVDELFNPFVVCLCENGDLLSQWRAYARDGVAIELAFPPSSTVRIIKDQDQDQKVTGEIDGLRPYRVFYGDAAVLNDSDQTHIADSQIVISSAAVTGDGGSVIKVSELGERVRSAAETGGLSEDDLLKALLPYVKSSGFKEESEWRLVVDLSLPDFARFRQAIGYQDNPNLPSTRRPYLRLKYGAAGSGADGVTVDVPQKVSRAWSDFQRKTGTTKATGLKKEVLRELGKLGPPVKFRTPPGYGRRSGDETYDISIITENAKDAEAVFEAVGAALLPLTSESLGGEATDPALGNKVNVWWGNVWPIRSIRVGPHPRIDEVKEAITHYCSTQWWIRQVKVVGSSIPYRPPRRQAGE